MFRPKITNFIDRPSLASILHGSSSSTPIPLSHNSGYKRSQLFHFSLYTSGTPSQYLCRYGVLPIKNVSDVSITRTASDDAFSHFSCASQVLENMRQQPERSDSLDVLQIYQSIYAQPNITKVAMVHGWAVKHGAIADLYTATSLITDYARCREFGLALGLFNEIVDRDVVFWNAMMTACVRTRRFEVTVHFFNQMAGEGIAFDFTTLIILTSAFSNLKCLEQSQAVHGLSIKAGMFSDTVLSNALIYIYSKCGDMISSEDVFGEVELKDLVTWNSMMSGCLYDGHPEKSLWYLRCMAWCDIRADDTSISCAIASCTYLQKFGPGLAIHGWGHKLGYGEENSISVANSLISFYSHFRDIYSAGTVFEAMALKDVVSWNAMIKGLYYNEEPAEAFRLLRDMQFVAFIQPDLATVLTAIPFCAELFLLREGKAFHGFAIRRNMASASVNSVTNSLINMYAKCDHVKEAEYLFTTMPRKDLKAWNTMISGYARCGMSLEAKVLFKKMLLCYSPCTLATLLAIIPSCDSPESDQFGKSIHGWSIKVGFCDQLFAINSLIHMYISCGNLPDAFMLFGSISFQGDVTSWNTIIAGCTQEGHYFEALRYFAFMRHTSRVHCNSITLVSVVSACGALGLRIQGNLIHGLALKTGILADIRVQNSLVTMYGKFGDTENARLTFNLSADHNLCSWNCVLSALSQNEDAKKALELFRALEFEPNEITFSTVLSACTQIGAITYGRQIHGCVFRLRFDRNPFISAALLDMYSHCGRLDIAEKVFLSAPHKSVSSWNSLISAYGFHTRGQKAIDTFEEMIRKGIFPTNSSFTSLLSSCSHTGLVDEGLLYYDLMLKKFKLQPTAEHHVCVVHMLGRSGKLQAAYDFIKNLATEPEPGIWGALLSACSSYGDLEMGREVAEILFSLEPENGSYYITLCNMYVAANRWEEAVELRTIFRDKQLKKTVGYSSIDITS